MNVFLLPIGLCDEIERMFNSFWWCNGGFGIKWMRWERLCAPREAGGLGFKMIRKFNLAMLGKQEWRFITNPTSLVSRVFRARYFRDGDFINAKKGHNPSFVWSSIWAARTVLIKGCRKRVGCGDYIKIGRDPWIVNNPQGKPSTILPFDIANRPVSSLFCVDRRSWDVEVIRDIFNETD
ncbi:Ribonuclease H-like superfamily protein [Euphorbia peplus]|nr:Ribonuclease H-like superfamily protein [Euphorbia peplus]